MTIKQWGGIFGLLVATACTTEDETNTIEVGDNALGVARVQIADERGERDRVFELTGFTAGGDERVRFTLHTGTIDDLLQWLPGTDSFGSELVLTVDGTLAERSVTRETNRFLLSPGYGGEDVASFLALDTVSAELERRANVIAAADAAATQPAEDAYDASSCYANHMLVTPVAKQCCSQFLRESNDAFTMFVRGGTNNVLVKRPANRGSYAGCKAADGASACSGAACYYGPLGFARAIITTYSSTTHIKIFSTLIGTYPRHDLACSFSTHATPQTPYFGDVTGTQPTNLGCPGGGTGAGAWDY